MPITTHKTASGNGLAQPYSITGKEKDAETGYSYYGARYYDSDLSGLFLSVDPMADKYPSISPYAYCATPNQLWNDVQTTANKQGINNTVLKHSGECVSFGFRESLKERK